MSEYQAGRTSAVFAVGTKVENISETYEREAQNFEAMKVAFAMSGKTLENYRESMIAEMKQAKIPIKEAEVGKTYINKCIELIRQLFNDSEAKRLQSLGAAEGVKQAVASIKRMYDEEQDKLEQHNKFEANPEKDLRQRPVGVDPTTVNSEAKTAKRSRRTKV